METPTGRSPGVLSADDLLAGGGVLHEVRVPLAVLRPAADLSLAPDGVELGTSSLEAAEGPGRGGHGQVPAGPLSVGTLTLISRAARDDASLVPLLMIK